MTDTMQMVHSRLQDPKGVLAENPAKLRELQEKVNRAITRLYKLPENGGNPFLFALAYPKPQEIAADLGGSPFTTAATDGKKFYWCWEFLDALDEDEVATVMSHEIYHVLFFHPTRMRGKDNHIANIAMDYSVNNTCEEEHEKSGRAKKYQLWGGKKLGKPLTFSDLLSYIDGKTELPKDPCVFVDAKLRMRSPESIYDEIMRHWDKSPRKCKEQHGGCGALSMDPKTGKPKKPGPYEPGTCPKCGTPPNPLSSMDSHMPSEADRQEVMHDMMRASEQAKAMRGTAPGAVEELLKELHNPELRARDIIRDARMRYRRDVGRMNDYRRLRRRGLSYDPPVYQWKKKDYASEWVAMIDTSGSMADHDIANGLKELQLVGGEGRGWIVPCDAAPHWKDKIEVTSKSDIRRTKVIGRGGTVFDDFFRGLKQNFPDGFDTVVIITDGDCGTIDPRLKPPCDVVWIITNRREFKPTFGRVCWLDPARP